MATKIVRKPALPATKKPAETAPVGLPPQKPFPPLTLISKATEKWPLANSDPRIHLGTIAARLREIVKYGKHLDELTQLDDQNPIVTVQPLLPIYLIFSAPAMLRALKRHSHGCK